jgi:sterol 3beta-glucosyltransferase
MFSDAALYEKILNACPETLKSGFFFNADDQTLPNCLGGFNQLIGRDLGDVERAVSGRLAELSVNNWASSSDDPFGADTPSEEDRGEVTSSDEGEDKKQDRLSASSTLQEEQPSEPKLTPEEIIDLLEQEFGALAPPGEEKLILEADAAFFNDVVVLVSPFFPSYRAQVQTYVLPPLFRVLSMSLRIDSRFMHRSYPLAQMILRKS